MSVPSSDDLARTRVLFEQWRATRQGRSKIPEELWQAVVALRARLREVENGNPLSPPAFVPLPLADWGGLTPSEPITTGEARIRLVWERTDGSRLRLSIPASQWTQAEALCTAFFRS
jgi:hypothetical protein